MAFTRACLLALSCFLCGIFFNSSDKFATPDKLGNQRLVQQYAMRHQDTVRQIRHIELERLRFNSSFEHNLPKVIIDPVTREENFIVNRNQQPINAGFIFYNMMSRSGGLSMQNIGKMLSIDNEFSFLRMDSNLVHTIDDQVLVQMLNRTVHPPFLLMKHHFYFDFTFYDHVLEPTYINIIRDPIDWFNSVYHFKRHGWKKNPKQRVSQNDMAHPDTIEQNINECIEADMSECIKYQPAYFGFICGLECTNKPRGEQLEEAKRVLLEKFYVVGIMEEFSLTVTLFEKMLPHYFTGANYALHSSFVQERVEMAESLNKESISETNKEKLKNGPLKLEYEFYDFARKLFQARVEAFDIKDEDPVLSKVNFK